MVVLITSAVNVVAPLTFLSDNEVRLNQLIDSVIKWLEKYPNVQIVICDGSGYDFLDCDLCNNLFSSENLELISFNYDLELVRKYGKGNGEGQIIKYALNNSKLLSNTEYFAKVTGRLFVNNANYYFKNTPENVYCHFAFNYKGIFIPNRCNTMDTRFYIIRKDFYKEHFLDLYKCVDDINGIFLEQVFFEKMIFLLSEKFHLSFWCNFEVTGISGSTGIVYYNYRIPRKIINFIRILTVRLFFKIFGVGMFNYKLCQK